MSATKPISAIQHRKGRKLFANKQHLAGHCIQKK